MTLYAGNDVFPAAVTIPDDTAPPTAANINAAIEGLADRTVWLKNRVGPMEHVLVAYGAVADGGSDSSALGTSFASLSMGGIQTIADMFTTAVALQVGDIVVVTFSANVHFSTDSGDIQANLQLKDNQNSTGYVLMPGSSEETLADGVNTPGSPQSRFTRMYSRGVRTITAAGIYSVRVEALAPVTSHLSAVLAGGSATGELRVYRATAGL